jgi:hypothetical protein
MQNRLRENYDLSNQFNLIWAVQSSYAKYFAFPHPSIDGYFRAVPPRQEGRTRRHERGAGCGGRGWLGETNEANADGEVVWS